MRAVDWGEAEVAVLMRPTRNLEDVFAVAERGETMPQKSTYLYPKLVSGLLFLDLGGRMSNGADPVGLPTGWRLRRDASGRARCPRRTADEGRREPVVGDGEGGDETTACRRRGGRVILERLRSLLF